MPLVESSPRNFGNVKVVSEKRYLVCDQNYLQHSIPEPSVSAPLYAHSFWQLVLTGTTRSKVICRACWSCFRSVSEYLRLGVKLAVKQILLQNFAPFSSQRNNFNKCFIVKQCKSVAVTQQNSTASARIRTRTSLSSYGQGA